MGKNKLVRVRDVMKPEFDRVEGIATVASALDAMEHHDSHALIVNKRDDDDEFGIVLLSDVAKEVLAKNRSPSRVNIYEIMSKPVICVRADMDIRYCIRLFENRGLMVAPVTEGCDGNLVGIVSYNDIVINSLKLLD